MNKNTKLTIFWHSFDLSYELRGRLSTLPSLYNTFGYSFPFEMPVVKSMPRMGKYKSFWSRKEKERVIDYTHYFEFNKELSEEELNFWRMWKLGYLCKWCRPQI